MLETILQLLITGVALGFVYALVGVEYTLVWQSSGLLNRTEDGLERQLNFG